MKEKIKKLKSKIKNKKEIFKQVNSEKSGGIQDFFSACGIRRVSM